MVVYMLRKHEAMVRFPSFPTNFMKNRIYIFVPRILAAYGPIMPAGRMGAQCAHATAKLIKAGYKGVENMYTLVMEVPTQYSLSEACLFLEKRGIRYIEQRDDFPPLITWQTTQAIITEPISKRKAKSLEKFQLWT